MFGDGGFDVLVWLGPAGGFLPWSYKESQREAVTLSREAREGRCEWDNAHCIIPPNARIRSTQITITPARAEGEKWLSVAEGDCGGGWPVGDSARVVGLFDAGATVGAVGFFEALFAVWEDWRQED